MNVREAHRIVSLLAADGTLTVSLAAEAITPPASGEVVIRVDGAPVNPADVKTLLCGIAPGELAGGATGLRGRVAPGRLAEFAGRLDIAVPAGNEGTGMVIAAGDDLGTQALLGRRVALAAGGMFSDYRKVSAQACMVLPDDTAIGLAAAAWINPMTALAMIETMRREGHLGLVLTAAASNLGHILGRLCRQDGVPYVAIVRSGAQVAKLRDQGVVHALDSSAPDFETALEQAISATGATLAFDATGGGTLAGQLLRGMERSLTGTMPGYSRYGTTVHKQVYFCGGLEPAPVTFRRDFGMAWGMGGWLLQHALARFGEECSAAMMKRVAADLGGVFASSFAHRIGLADLLAPDAVAGYATLATGGKFLVCP